MVELVVREYGSHVSGSSNDFAGSAENETPDPSETAEAVEDYGVDHENADVAERAEEDFPPVDTDVGQPEGELPYNGGDN